MNSLSFAKFFHMRMLFLISIALITSFLSKGAAQNVYAPSQIPNVQLENKNRYVSDPAGMLNPETIIKADAILGDIREKSTAEVVAIIVPSIGDLEPSEFCEEVFTDWGIGKNDKDNGMILLITPDDRRAWIQTGYGLEGVMPDIKCSEIVRQTIVPAMKQGNLDQALLDAAGAINATLTSPDAISEIRSGKPDVYENSPNVIDADTIWSFIKIISLCVFIFCLACFCHDLWKGRRLSSYDRALLWRSHLPMYGWGALLSVGTAAIFLLLAYFMYRNSRLKPRRCNYCGEKMKLLSEEKDNEKLNPSQDLEEQLDSVDYDVWVCPKCDAVEKYAYKTKNSKYTECPVCHTRAMALLYLNLI